jgi:endonuclease G
VPRTDNQGRWLLKNGAVAGPDADDGEIDWIANEGIRASRIVSFVVENGERGPLLDNFQRAAAGQLRPESTLGGGPEKQSGGAVTSPPILIPGVAGIPVTVPVTFTIVVEGLSSKPIGVTVAPAAATEKAKVPFVDPNYGERPGYDSNFLGLSVPLPDVVDPNRVAQLDDGSCALPYNHFSIIMDKSRRLALVTASNIDVRPEKKEPEPSRDYSRKGLGGLGPNDTEQWLMDPRIPEAHQLPDRFYTRDGGAFDKGHLVRREDVCWGDTFPEVRWANGDTYHTTNCSPQVADFNQSSRGGIWGKLENEILRQAKTEGYCIFAGPWLQTTDREFVGRDHRGEIRILIPSKYWKIVVARASNQLQAFAFVLEQDLGDVPLEFAVSAEWLNSMVSIRDLEAGLGYLRFPKELHQADQFGTAAGAELLRMEALRGLERK